MTSLFRVRRRPAVPAVTLLFLWLVPFAARALEGPRTLGPKPPTDIRRVVTLAPSLTETVLALGRGELLVGVSRYDTAAAVAALPRVGGFNDPSVEAVLRLRPDLVLAESAPANRRAVEKMAQLGAPVLVVPLHDVKQTLNSLEEIGRALDQSAEAKTLVQGIESTRREVRERNRNAPMRRVVMVYGFEPLVVAGPGSFAHELLTDLHVENLAQDAANPFTVYPLERVVRAKPELVIDASDSDVGRAKTMAMPGLKDTHWARLPTLDLLQPGPGLGRGLLELESLVRPPAKTQMRAPSPFPTTATKPKESP